MGLRLIGNMKRKGVKRVRSSTKLLIQTYSTCLPHDVVELRATWWLLQHRVVTQGVWPQGPTSQTKDWPGSVGCFFYIYKSALADLL
jgi:hypothetical protein